tara:strand:+ start:707 stop:1645 length:939 start_codon:yes stop_codon:yes gene_type:complete
MVNLWINDISILLNKNYIFEIIPSTSFDLNRKSNAIFRFSIYFSIISFAIYKQNSVFCFPFIVMIITIYIFKYSGGESNDNLNKIEGSIKSEIDPLVILQNKNKNCIIPKQNNPFMNLNMFDISKNKKPGCLSYDNEGVKEEIDNIFDEGLYKDPTDIYSNNNSQNRYYTMPNTKPANDQGLFADWLYKTTNKSCKEPGGGVQCSSNLYNRLNDNGNWRASGGGGANVVQGLDRYSVKLSTDIYSKKDDKQGDSSLYDIYKGNTEKDETKNQETAENTENTGQSHRNLEPSDKDKQIEKLLVGIKEILTDEK